MITQALLEEFKAKKRLLDEAKSAYDEIREIIVQKECYEVEPGDRSLNIKVIELQSVNHKRLVNLLGLELASKIKAQMPVTLSYNVRVF